MAGEFDIKQYVDKWDRIVLPIMLTFIVSAIVAVFAMNKAASPDCKRHEFVFCGTSMDDASDH